MFLRKWGRFMVQKQENFYPSSDGRTQIHAITW